MKELIFCNLDSSHIHKSECISWSAIRDCATSQAGERNGTTKDEAIQVLGTGKQRGVCTAQSTYPNYHQRAPSWTREALLSKALLNKAVQPLWRAALMRLRDFCCAGFLAQRYLKSLHRIRSYGTEIPLRNGLTVSEDMKSRSVSLSVL